MKKDKQHDRKFLSQIVSRNEVHGYDDGKDKRNFHLVGSRVLRAIAGDIGLEKDEFEVRSNKGGVAVSGEVILHADNLYIQFYANGTGKFLYRRCKSRQDYCGETNYWFSFEELATDEGILKFVRNCINTMNRRKIEVCA
jgi:hypothetical protein